MVTLVQTRMHRFVATIAPLARNCRLFAHQENCDALVNTRLHAWASSAMPLIWTLVARRDGGATTSLAHQATRIVRTPSQSNVLTQIALTLLTARAVI